jgi:hypothetical protein
MNVTFSGGTPIRSRYLCILSVSRCINVQAVMVLGQSGECSVSWADCLNKYRPPRQFAPRRRLGEDPQGRRFGAGSVYFTVCWILRALETGRDTSPDTSDTSIAEVSSQKPLRHKGRGHIGRLFRSLAVAEHFCAGVCTVRVVHGIFFL